MNRAVMPVGLGLEVRVLDPVDRVEEPFEPARRDHPFGIGRAAVGVDDLAAGQGADALGQRRVALQMRQGDLVHPGEVGPRLHPVQPHQPGQRRAVVAPVFVAQAVRLFLPDAERLHHEIGHPHLDLVEEPRLGRIERVVEIEDPCRDMGKQRHEVDGEGGVGHGSKLCPAGRGGKRRLAGGRPARLGSRNRTEKGMPAS